MTIKEQINKLWLLKISQDLDVYYQVTDYKGIPVLKNRVNRHTMFSSGRSKNKWIGFTNYVVANEDNTYTIRCIFDKDKEDQRSLFLKENVPITECLYWMKQFYSAARIINRTLEEEPTTTKEILDSEIYSICWTKLKKISMNNSFENLEEWERLFNNNSRGL